MDLVTEGHMQEGIVMVRYNWIYFPVFVIYLNLFTGFLFLILFSAARSFFHKFREDHEVMHSRDLQKLEAVLSPSHLEVI